MFSLGEIPRIPSDPISSHTKNDVFPGPREVLWHKLNGRRQKNLSAMFLLQYIRNFIPGFWLSHFGLRH